MLHEESEKSKYIPSIPSKAKRNHIAKTIRSVYNLTPKQLKARAKTKEGKRTRKMNRNKNK